MFRDIRYGLRQVRKHKGFAAIVVLLVAIGLGANTVIFSLTDALLMRPLPVRNPYNLFLLEKIAHKQVRPDTEFIYDQFEAARKTRDVFSSVVAEEQISQRAVVPCDFGSRVRLVTTQLVSTNYFEELGLSAAAGRLFSADDLSASEIPAVISFQFWQTQFGSDKSILGHTLRLKGHPVVIIGVLPRAFHSSDQDRAPDVRLPISAAPLLRGSDVHHPTGDERVTFQLISRLAPGISPAQAAAAIRPSILMAEESGLREWNVGREHPFSPTELQQWLDIAKSSHLKLLPIPRGVSQLREQFSRALMLLLGAGVLLQLIICASVAGLFLAKSEDRRKEIAVRLSLGAPRWVLVRQILTEYALLACLGTGFALAAFYPLSTTLISLLPPARDFGQYSSPQLLSVAANNYVFLFMVFLAIITICISGILPAYRATALNLNTELKHAGRGFTGRSAIAVLICQVMLAFVLLTCAALMVKTFWKLLSLNPGFDRSHLASFTIDPNSAGYSPAQAGQYFRQLREQVGNIPGVRSAAYASRGLMRGVGIKATVAPQGSKLPANTYLNTSVNMVTAEYFQTVGMPLLRGRLLDIRDAGRNPSPVVINEAFAAVFFRGEDPIGKYLVNGPDGTKPPNAVVVGVTTTTKYRSLREEKPPTTYSLLDLLAGTERPLVLYVRTYGNPENVIAPVRSIMQSLDPSVPLLEAFTVEEEIENSLWQERLINSLIGFFAIVALILTGVGVYGALAASVAQRTRELGIRVALGARANDMPIAVCRPIFWVLGSGLLSGLIIAALLTRVLRNQLYGVTPLDPFSFGIASLFILLCAGSAAVVPIWRATKLDPASALHQE